MTVVAQPRIASHVGDGISTDFPFGFKVLSATELLVVHIETDGREVVQQLGTDYTVSGAGEAAGGLIIYQAPPAMGLVVHHIGLTTLSATLDLEPGGPFSSAAIEASVDKLTRIAQEIFDALGRVPRFPYGESPPVFPRMADRGGKVLGFSADGTLFALGPDISTLGGGGVTSLNGQTGDLVISAASLGALTDAPLDGSIYGRQDGAWVVVEGGGASALSDLTDVDLTISAQGNVLVQRADGGFESRDVGFLTLTLGDIDDVVTVGGSPGDVLTLQANNLYTPQALSVTVAQILDFPTLATVATSGAYSDLSGTPSLATVATSGSYNDLSDRPTIPTTLTYDIQFGFLTPPGSDAVIHRVVLPRAVNWAANFAPSAGAVGTNPAASFAIDVQDDGVSIGTITVATNGTVSFATAGGVAQSAAAGSVLTFVAPTAVDASIANATFTLGGSVAA